MKKIKQYHFTTSGYGPIVTGSMVVVSSGNGKVHHNLPWCIADDQWTQLDNSDWPLWPTTPPPEPILECYEYCPECLEMAKGKRQLWPDIPAKMKLCITNNSVCKS